MINVIQFIRGISDGGAETLVKEYSRLIDKKIYSVTVVGLFVRKHSANYRSMKENGIEIVPVYKHWNFFVKLFNKIFGRIYVPFFLYRVIKRKQTNVLHCHMTVLKYVRPIWKKLKNIKLFYTCHSIPEKYFGKQCMDEFRAAKWLIEHNNLRLIALHEDMMIELNQMFGIDHTEVIHNGIDFSRFENIEESKEAIRDELNIPSNAFVIGHVGRFHEVKNHKFLVEVFKAVKQVKSNAFLLMVGDGAEKEHIEHLIYEYGLSKSALILSNRTDTPKLYKAMDIFVFPSLYEGLGIVMIEAQKSGLRCVASTAVPKDAFVTELAVGVDLDGSVNQWVNAILKHNMQGVAHGDFSDYDINHEIMKLEKLYRLY